jgi:segregation and condensation protein B
MSLKAKIEALIYAAEEPVTIDQIADVLKEAGLLAELLQPAEGAEPQEVASMAAAEKDAKTAAKAERNAVRAALKPILEELEQDYATDARGMELKQVASGYRITTKPEHHDVVKTFAKSLKPPVRLSLQSLETLAVIAYKQPVTSPEISEIRGVDSSGVLATLIDRKLITTAGRKAVVGRPILYKTTKDFLMRFGLKDIHELPSMEEFEKMTHGAQESLFDNAPVADATGVPHDDSSEPRSADAPSQEDASEERTQIETEEA